MQLFLYYESFFYCPRNDLERLQPLSRSLRNLVANRSRTLPLRSIDRVLMDVICVPNAVEEIQIFVEKTEDGYEPEPDYKASIHDDDGDFAEIFRRLQHTCIKHFDVYIVDSPFLRYWTAQAAAVFTVVTIYFHIALSEYHDVFDSIVNHVRPKATLVVAEGPDWEENGMNHEHMKALTRRSLLNSLQTCLLRVSVEGFPPPSCFLNEPGYAKYELWCLHRNAGNWIDGFIETFVRDGCTNRKLESVFVGWDDDEDQQSLAPKQLSKPTKREIPLPKMELTALHNLEVHQVTQCEAHSFVSSKHWMRMDVFKWSAYDSSGDATHILQCRVQDL